MSCYLCADIYQNGQLKKIAVSGGTPVFLCEATNPFGVNWGTDDTILFGQREGIMRVSANGGTPELVVATEGELVHGPELLPGGEWVLFTLTRASGPTRWDEAEIVVQSLESGGAEGGLDRWQRRAVRADGPSGLCLGR